MSRLTARAATLAHGFTLRGATRSTSVAYTLFGIPVTFDLSFAFVAALATWTFADVVLPSVAPGRSAPAYWTGAGAGTLLALMSIVVHELGHAIVARRVGLGVRGMALSLFGGATELSGAPRTPGAAFVIAAAGPIASLVLAVASAIAHVVLVESDADPLAAAIPALAAIANLAIAALNLLPGLPLDGGQVLSATVWRITGRRADGVRVASAAGRGLAVLIGALSVIGSASGDAGLALWFALIAMVMWAHASDAAETRSGVIVAPESRDATRVGVGVAAIRRGRTTRAA